MAKRTFQMKKVKDLQMEKLSWIIQMGPKCDHKCPFKKKAEEYLTTEEGNVTRKAERDLKMVCC
jgi:hypothetical protein